MDMNFVKFLGMNLIIWVIAGVVLFVPLANFLNSYMKNPPQRLSYKMGVLWGVLAGSLFSYFHYFHVPLKYVLIISGSIIVVSILYRKFIKKS